MDLQFISDLDFRQTGLNQSSVLTYKSLSESRQLKDVWQVWKLSISHPEVLSLFWDSSIYNAVVLLKLKIFLKPFEHKTKET